MHACIALRFRRTEARLRAGFTLPVRSDDVYLNRTHPLVEGLATYVPDAALDPLVEAVARRCGAIRTRAVRTRTTLLLVRFRYHIVTRTGTDEYALLAEDCSVLAFEGAPEQAR